jgi:hypothetical protein
LGFLHPHQGVGDPGDKTEDVPGIKQHPVDRKNKGNYQNDYSNLGKNNLGGLIKTPPDPLDA